MEILIPKTIVLLNQRYEFCSHGNTALSGRADQKERGMLTIYDIMQNNKSSKC